MRKIILVLAACSFVLYGCVSAPDIHKAAREGDTAGIIKMMDEGAFPDIPDRWSHRPLHYACDAGHLEVAKALLDRGADPDSLDKSDNRPIHYTCTADVLALLLERGADKNAKNKDKVTPLHAAMLCPENEVQLVRLLIDKGAGVDEEDTMGFTPLHMAVGYADSAAVRLLAESGADINVQNIQELTARDMAAVTGKDDIVDILDANSGRSEKYFSKGTTKTRFERGKLIGTEIPVPMKKSYEGDSGFVTFELDIDWDGVDTTLTAFGPYSHYTYKGFDTVYGRFFAEPGHTYIIDAQYKTGALKSFAVAKDKETGRTVGVFR